MLKIHSALSMILLSLLLAPESQAICNIGSVSPGNQLAKVETSLGTLCIELLAVDAPLHVANFLFYLEEGLLDDTFFHRSMPGFILQGAGYTVGSSDYEAVPQSGGTVTNEPCTLDVADPLNPGGQICSERGNERGTIALAKLGGDPNSGTTNWFINLVDNRSNLDNQNEGFTVFGRLIDNSIDVADAVAALQVASDDELAWKQTAFTSFTSLPLLAPTLTTPFGCWDPAVQVSALVKANLPGLQGYADPVVPGGFMQLSANCGTSIPTPDSAADVPAPDSCDGPGGVAIRTSGPLSPSILGGYFEFTCAEVQESFDQRALWLAAYQPHFDQQLVFIESATELVPPGVPSFSWIGAALLSCLLAGGGLGALRIGGGRAPTRA